MGKIAELRAALAGALTEIADTEKKAYVNKKVATTTLSVIPAPDDTIDYQTSFGAATFAFQIEALTPMGDFESAQKRLDELIEPYGDKSVKQALETSEHALLRKKTIVTSVERYGARTMTDGTLMLGANINVTVTGSAKP